MTDMQESFLFSKMQPGESDDSVGCHLYYEFTETNLDVERLTQSWNLLIKRHQMLRAVMKKNRTQEVFDEFEPIKFQEYDFSDATLKDQLEIHLNYLRETMGYRKYAVNEWPLFNIKVTHLPDNQSLIHFSIDEWIVDISSVMILMSQWYKAYQTMTIEEQNEIDFSDYIDYQKRKETEEEFKQKLRAIVKKTAKICGPEFPVIQEDISKMTHFERKKMSFLLDENETNYIKKKAQEYKITTTSIVLTAFLTMLEKYSKSVSFSIILTFFNRIPIHPDIEKVVGPFVSTAFFEWSNIENGLETEKEKHMRVQKNLWRALDNSDISSIRLIRELNKIKEKRNLLPPVISFTSLLRNQTQDDESFFQKITYSISQTPHIFLDNQVYEVDGKICCFWDIIPEYFGIREVEKMFNTFKKNLLDQTKLNTNSIQKSYAFNKVKKAEDYYSYHELIVEQADPVKLAASWNQLNERHSGLRMSLNEDYSMNIIPHSENEQYNIVFHDIREQVEPAEIKETLLKTRSEVLNRDISIFNEYQHIFHVTLLKENKAIIHLKINAVFLDGKSIQLILSELSQLYIGKSIQDTDNYLEYIEQRNSQEQDFNSDYWESLDSKLAPEPTFDSSNQGKAGQSDVNFYLTDWPDKKKVILQAGLLPDAFLFGIYVESIKKYCLENEFMVTFVDWGRDKEYAKSIGEFTKLIWIKNNNLPFPKDHFQYLSDINEGIKNCHSQKGLQKISKSMMKKKTKFSVVYSNILEEENSNTLPVLFEQINTPAIGLDFNSYEIGNDLKCKMSFSFNHIDESTVYGIVENFRKEVDKKIEKLPLSKKQLVETSRLVARFSKMADKYPNKTAVRINNQTISYQELDMKSSKLAEYLLEKGATDFVGICFQRSIELIISIVAVLKSGCGYIPIDYQNPKSRIDLIIKDSKLDMIISEEEFLPLFAGYSGEVLLYSKGIKENCSSNRTLPVSFNDIAYVIYTSGSTGIPKGVKVSHDNVLSLFKNVESDYQISENDVWTLFHSYGFDFSVWEIFGALLYGGTLEIVPQAITKNPKKFVELIEEKSVTFLNLTPTAFYQICPILQKRLHENSLRIIVLGGEKFNFKKLSTYYNYFTEKNIDIFNMYGITETTVHVTSKKVEESDIVSGISNIGKPIENIDIYLLNDSLEKVATGEIGEIYVSGTGVSQGYMQEEMNKHRFLANPFRTGEILYKTGDLGRELPEGEFEYLSRADNQVQIRGYRIELGEIENQLLSYSKVIDAVINIETDHANNRLIIAYVISTELLNLAELKHFMNQRLPEYMVPNKIEQVAVFPMTANNKIDLKQLSLDRYSKLNQNLEIQPEQSDSVINVQMIVKDILGLDELPAVSSDLFELGLTSLSMLELIEEIKTKYAYTLSIDYLLDKTTIKDIYDVLPRTQAKNSIIHQPSTIERFLSIVQTVLQLNKLPDEDEDIFNLGATSLSIIELTTEIANSFGVTLTIEDLLGNSQIKEIYSLVVNDENHLIDFSLAKPVKKLISLEVFTDFISLLRGKSIKGVYKYLYPSTGGKNAVQTYLIVNNSKIEGLSKGAYFYNPIMNSLQLINQELSDSVFEEEIIDKVKYCNEDVSFYVFFVAQLAAIRPLYLNNSEAFSTIDSGYMTQLLYTNAKKYDFSVGIIKELTNEALKNILKLSDEHLAVNGLYITSGTNNLLPVIEGNRQEVVISEERLQQKEIKGSKQFNILMPDDHRILEEKQLQIRKTDIINEIQLSNQEFSYEQHEKRSSQRVFSSSVLEKITLHEYLSQLRDDNPRKASLINSNQLEIYVYIKKNRVTELEEGLYQFNQLNGELTEIRLGEIQTIEKCHFPTNRRIARSAGFFIFILEKSTSESFLTLNLESGILGQVLMESQKDYGIGLVPIGGLNFEVIREYFVFDTDNVCLHSFMGGHRLTDEAMQEGSYNKIYELSRGQQALFYEYLCNPKNTAYNTVSAVKVSQEIDQEKMNKALALLLKDYPILRTSFKLKEGIPVQEIQTDYVPSVGYVALEAENLQQIEKQCEEECQKCFNLETDVLRSCIISVKGKYDVFVLVIHHIVTDYFSTGILLKHLWEIYFSLINSEVPEEILPELEYFQYIAEEKKYEKSKEYIEDQTYWIDKLKPYYHGTLSQTNHQSDNIGETSSFKIDKELFEKIKKISASNKLTVNTILFSTFLILNAIEEADELNAVGMISDIRTGKTKNTVGYFINPIIIASLFQENETPIQYFERIQKDIFAGLKHRQFPLSSLKKELAFSQPLFNKTFQFLDRISINNNELLEELEIKQQEGQFELELELKAMVDGSLQGQYKYNSSNYSKDRITQYIKQYQRILNWLVAHSNEQLKAMEKDFQRKLLLQTEERAILQGPSIVVPHNNTFASLIEREAMIQPDKVAIVGLDEQQNRIEYTYEVLNGYANQLAYYLLEKMEKNPISKVGICLSKSPKYVVATLALFKLGVTVIPIDIENPQKRIQYILADAGVDSVIYDSREFDISAFSITDTIDINAISPQLKLLSSNNILLSIQTENPAYMIYTSGSTGKPKGVCVSNESAMNTLYGYLNSYWSEAYKRHLQMASVGFDVYIGDILRSLCMGQTLVLCKKEQIINIRELYQIIVDEKIDFAESVPSVLRELCKYAKKENKKLTTFKSIVISSDAWSFEDIKSFREVISESTKLLTTYGVTEAAIDSTYMDCSEFKSNGKGFCPIGFPLANVSVYVVDKNMKIVSKGEKGELCIGGKGVSKGYHERAELTAEKFIELDTGNTTLEYVYKTGDLVRINEYNELEFFGRIDNQVKLRGQRIELGEIENQLKRIEGIEEVVALIKKESENEYLVAFYTQSINSIEESLIRKKLKKELPSYMIPTVLVSLPEFPLNVNGKVDRKKLSSKKIDKLNERLPLVKACVSPYQKIIRDVWEDLLNHNQFSDDNDFFDVGGHSFLVLKMLDCVNEKCAASITVSEALKSNTVNGLASLINKRKQAELAQVKPTTEQPVYHFKGSWKQPENILLTGATGFLGSHLLSELLKEFPESKVYCLIRKTSSGDGAAKLEAVIEEMNLSSTIDMSRIQVITGDLEAERLGMEPSQYDIISSQIDVVYHVGAAVNFAYSYRDLKASNVEGTKRILDFSCNKKMKKVNFISTTSVFDNYLDESEIAENTPLKSENIDKLLGYSQSKIAAEKIVNDAREQGLVIDIYRPSVISGSEKTSIWNKKDFSYQLLNCFIQLNAVPDIEMTFDWVPVDRVSSIIVQLSSKANNNNNFHIVSPEPITISELKNCLNEFQPEIRTLPFNLWKNELEKRKDEFLFWETIIEAVSYNASGKITKYGFENVKNILGDQSVLLKRISTETLRAYYEKGFVTDKRKG